MRSPKLKSGRNSKRFQCFIEFINTIMSELNRAPFTRKRHRARSVARFCWTRPYMYVCICVKANVNKLRGTKYKGLRENEAVLMAM